VVTWRQAQMAVLSAQAVDVARIAKVTFTSVDQAGKRGLMRARRQRNTRAANGSMMCAILRGANALAKCP
jgi:hypothetical protein